jgi:glucose-6-phosphate 1-epimerase
MLFDFHTVGATLLNWEYNDIPVLYCSEKAIFEEGKAIRGGVPICFPWFGPKEGFSQHGFARTKEWDLVENHYDGESQKVVLELISDEETLGIWPYDFEASLTIEAKENSIKITFDIYNCNDVAFDFTFALHTYFSIDDIAKTKIEGLQNHQFIDKVDEKKIKMENDAFISITGEVDRVYKLKDEIPNIYIHDKENNRKIKVLHEGISDIIVWNPWIDKAKSIVDMGDNDYLRFVCVEGGIASSPYSLLPDSYHSISQTIIIE